MNNEQRLEAMDSYFSRYRKTLDKLKQNDEHSKELRESFEKRRIELSDDRTRITRELNKMRQTITKVIDQGIDPMMASLSMDDNDIHSDMWAQVNDENFGMDTSVTDRLGRISGLTTADLSTINLSASLSLNPASVGATGSSGPFMHNSGTVLAGYGAVPPQHKHPSDYHDDCEYGNGIRWTGTAEP